MEDYTLNKIAENELYSTKEFLAGKLSYDDIDLSKIHLENYLKYVEFPNKFPELTFIKKKPYNGSIKTEG